MQKTFIRDVLMLATAAALGWWAHGANTPVQAQHSGSSSTHDGNNLSFQISGVGRDAKLNLFNPDSHMLYVYPMGIDNGKINCELSFHIDRPGGTLERQNCPMGSAF